MMLLCTESGGIAVRETENRRTRLRALRVSRLSLPARMRHVAIAMVSSAPRAVPAAALLALLAAMLIFAQPVYADGPGFLPDPGAWFDYLIKVKLFGSFAKFLFDAGFDVIKQINTQSIITGSFDTLLGTGEHSMAVLSSLVADTVIKPCANTVLAMVVLIQLLKIAKRMDHAGGALPALREVFTLFVMLAIFMCLVNNGGPIMQGVFELMQRIPIKIGKLVTSPDFGLDGAILDPEKLPNAVDAMVLCVVGLLFLLLTIVVSVIAQCMAIGRGLEIYLFVMFAPLPFAFAGFDETRSWAVGFFKNFLSVCLQGALMIVILYAFPLLVSGMLSGESLDYSKVLHDPYILKLLAAELMCALALVKSGSLASKILGGA